MRVLVSLPVWTALDILCHADVFILSLRCQSCHYRLHFLALAWTFESQAAGPHRGVVLAPAGAAADMAVGEPTASVALPIHHYALDSFLFCPPGPRFDF